MKRDWLTYLRVSQRYVPLFFPKQTKKRKERPGGLMAEGKGY